MTQKNPRERTPFITTLLRKSVVIGITLFAGGAACFANGSDDEGEAQSGASGGATSTPSNPKQDPMHATYALRPHSLRQGLMDQLNEHCAEQVGERVRQDIPQSRAAVRAGWDIPPSKELVALWHFLITGERTATFETAPLLKIIYPENHTPPPLTNDDISPDAAFPILLQATANYIHRWIHARDLPPKDVAPFNHQSLVETILDVMMRFYLNACPPTTAPAPTMATA